MSIPSIHEIHQAYERSSLRVEIDGCIMPVSGWYVNGNHAIGVELSLGDTAVMYDLQAGDRLLCREDSEET